MVKLSLPKNLYILKKYFQWKETRRTYIRLMKKLAQKKKLKLIYIGEDDITRNTFFKDRFCYIDSKVFGCRAYTKVPTKFYTIFQIIWQVKSYFPTIYNKFKETKMFPSIKYESLYVVWKIIKVQRRVPLKKENFILKTCILNLKIWGLELVTNMAANYLVKDII